MNQNTTSKIEQHAKSIFALYGYEGLSMRMLSEQSDVGLSSIYHFYEDKDVLLSKVFTKISQELGKKRKSLPTRKLARSMLEDRIDFQFRHIEDIVYVYKYYLHFRDVFMKKEGKILPKEAYEHIEEVLHKGLETGEFKMPNDSIVVKAKITTHAINGFLIEYFPKHIPRQERMILTLELTNYIMNSLQYREVVMK